MRAASPTATLIGAIGLLRSLQLGVLMALRGGRPFAHLEPPAHSRERLSRAQAAMAIRLYRGLRSMVSEERALEVAGQVIEAGAVQFLGRTLGDLDGPAFAALPLEERRKQALGWLDRFFTATASLDHVTDDEVGFTVSACALARLCREAGHPELAPAFCRGDALFFAAQTPPIELARETTLAQGGSCCPFRLRLRRAPQPEGVTPR